MQDIRIGFLQFDIKWEDAEQNRRSIEEHMQSNRKMHTLDLLVLPEMFSTGFTMTPQPVAEEMTGDTVQWMQEQARQFDCAIAGSLVISEKGSFYNRMIFMGPEGILGTYDKRHLFRMAGEENHYSPGQTREIIEWRGWRVLLQICYDLRFPVFIRNQNDYDLALFVANWPAPRRMVWNTLLVARALENQSYILGVNRVGTDGKGIAYAGDSQLVSPKGEVHSLDDKEGIDFFDLSKSDLINFRSKFPVHLDADQFNLQSS